MKPVARLDRLRNCPLNSPGFAAAVIFVGLLLCQPAGFGSTPEISLIEFFSTNQVLLHFDTDANRTYTLQYSDHLGGTGTNAPVWSNLYKAPLLPFPNHYIVVDTRTNKMRFYRLSVTR